ncbi:dual specificity tyrosine-phosphorylation-regulated kinase 4-like [Gadus chalcogrammus]|uniref:dual specificity tyrosine-phosphorylation-regulated kinase 4-like n=1 Tax=Gadus chalcogrammus TaxID=1042646 RepID=UPI0024C2A1D5|nr:dual specificity tyrosine-phosphorylation-regulated kinase 4-like [Gadus chalcogrammus]
MRPPNASTVFRKHLTPFEQRGIKQYKEVWSLGIAEEKVQETYPLRHGDDDSEGHYKMMQVIKDHIAYRYEILELMGEGTFGRVLKCRDHKTQQLEAMKVIANDQRYADEAMAEVEILELLQKKDVLDVANVVHMKEHVHLRNQMDTHNYI